MNFKNLPNEELVSLITTNKVGRELLAPWFKILMFSESKNIRQVKSPGTVMHIPSSEVFISSATTQLELTVPDTLTQYFPRFIIFKRTWTFQVFFVNPNKQNL